MHSINPFLRAFFKSNIPSQCTPVSNHILLVPTTECLLTGRDREANAAYADIASSEDFLSSHVLKIPAPQAGDGTFRDSRGKAKQYNTINGRSVVVKESFVYSNKGFKNLNQAQLLSDQIYYSDSLDPQQWLVYYISRPMVGSYEPIKPTIALLANTLKESRDDQPNGSHEQDQPRPAPLPKGDVNSFNDLLNQFPMISRQMQTGLDKVFKDFTKAMNDWVPSRVSRASSSSSQRSLKSPSLRSNGSAHSTRSSSRPARPLLGVRLAEEADFMRTALEGAVNTAIELFQKVDKQQLSFLGTSTHLTGIIVEKMIERHIAEQLHDSFLFPRLCNSSKMEDMELEDKIHAMQYIDVGQVGIAIDGGKKEKDQLMAQIAKGAEEFRKVGVASSPQQMLEVLVNAQKFVTGQASDSTRAENHYHNPSEKRGAQTMNADTLVSLLLVVVIRSQVRHLHARLAYMRDFVFIEDVDSGEMGYALSTFEAVLSYLSTDSAGLRKASLRNRKIWQSAGKGDVGNLKANLEYPQSDAPSALITPLQATREDGRSEGKDDAEGQDYFSNATSSTVSSAPHTPADDGSLSQGSTLAHVFPFKPQPDPPKKKKVSMDVRSLSNASDYSFISRTTTLDSRVSAIESDTSVETLAQTQDNEGNSIPMMAVEAGQVHALEYLLSLEHFYPTSFIVEDTNNEGTTLLMAAVQHDCAGAIDLLLKRIFGMKDDLEILDYFARADNRGRTVAHYLFNCPWLLSRIGELLPWTQKDKIGQTPLLALFRSYDHPHYSQMLHIALEWAAFHQGNDEPLHLDDHVDAKGNTLLHVVNDPNMTIRLLQQCDADPNAITRDKKFTPLMQASKFGRMDVVRALFSDPRVDFLIKELRGLTAVELAKDDEIRNRIDDMVLVSNVPALDGRVTSVVRSFFVEDATIRLIIKSATRSGDGVISVTTGRRSLTDFEHLAKWLALEHPASWLPSIFNFRSPFQIASRPSKAVLEDIQTRLDGFLKLMLAHSTFSTHELLWEFVLFPEIQPDMMAERSRKKAEIRSENIREEYVPVENVREVSSFVDHARESIRSIDHSTKSVTRRVIALRLGHSNLATVTSLLSTAICTLPFLPDHYLNAFQRYTTCLQPPASDPLKAFQAAFFALHTTIAAILSSLARPHSLISQLGTLHKAIERHTAASNRSDRWPLALLDDSRAEAATKAEQARRDLTDTGCELMYTWQTVAGELAGWHDLHALMGRRAIKSLARGMVVRERDRLEGMKRALRVLQKGKTGWE